MSNLSDKAKKMVEKAGMIVEGFTTKYPVGQKWYDERISICESCPYNSDNVPDEKKGAIHTAHVAKCLSLSGGHTKRFCTACSCCIDEKALVKKSVCGLVEIGKDPLWKALEVENESLEGFSMEVVGKVGYKVSAEGAEFIADFGETSEDLLDFKFRIFAPIQFPFISSVGGCTCTVADSKQIDDNRREFSIRISTKEFNKDVYNVRPLLLNYKGRSITIRFKIFKK